MRRRDSRRLPLGSEPPRNDQRNAYASRVVPRRRSIQRLPRRLNQSLEFGGVPSPVGSLTICDACSVIHTAEISQRLTPDQLGDLAGVIACETAIRELAAR
jgi:hypothetical protein